MPEINDLQDEDTPSAEEGGEEIEPRELLASEAVPEEGSRGRVPLDPQVEDAPRGFTELEDEPGTIGSESGEYFTTPGESEQARLRVHDAQVALVSLAYLDADAISDVWDLPTKDAMAEFQEENGFVITGQLDVDSYAQLLGAYEAGLEVQRTDSDVDDFDPIHAEGPLRR